MFEGWILLTVSRESAPSVANFDSPVTSESAGSASCFLTMSHTLFTVSGLACSALEYLCWLNYQMHGRFDNVKCSISDNL